MLAQPVMRMLARAIRANVFRKVVAFILRMLIKIQSEGGWLVGVLSSVFGFLLKA